MSRVSMGREFLAAVNEIVNALVTTARGLLITGRYLARAAIHDKYGA